MESNKQKFQNAKRTKEFLEPIQKIIKDYLSRAPYPHLFQTEEVKKYMRYYSGDGGGYVAFKAFGLPEEILSIIYKGGGRNGYSHEYDNGFHPYFLKALNQVCMEHLDEIFALQAQMVEKSVEYYKNEFIKETQDLLKDLEKE